MRKTYTTLIIILITLSVGHATHNRAGEITYKQISELTYEITVTTFTSTRPNTADRPFLDVQWGDGTYNEVARIEELYLPDYYKRNTYVYKHTYPGAGTYEIVVEDPNRNEGVENISGSINVPFAIRTTLQINPLIGHNNTPVLLNPPIDNAAQNRIFVHNPAAYDPDGDSLSYKLTICLGQNGDPIPDYQFPESSNEPIYVDPISGDLVWNTPTKLGIYNVAIAIEEWRMGIKIGEIIRDMQIEVKETDNMPPIIEQPANYCGIAGDTIQFDVVANDSIIDFVEMTSSSGVYVQETQPAQWISDDDFGRAVGHFFWATHCSHIRKRPYQVIYKAIDNNDEVVLVDIKSNEVRVIAPPPELVSLTPTNSTISLNWNTSACGNSIGYNIYRKEKESDWKPGECETGVPAYSGFEKIATIDNIATSSFIDNNDGKGLYQGHLYCYRITEFYEDGAESVASNQMCADLVRGIPTITKISVAETSPTSGKIELKWLVPTEFDTLAAPGPYQYEVFRSYGFWGEKLTKIATLDGIRNTELTDKLLNTKDSAYSYSVKFYNNSPGNRFLIGSPQVASSTFLIINAADNELNLSFKKNVPWIDTAYVVYRFNELENRFDSIGFTKEDVYTDDHLQNGTEYCYKAKALAYYTMDEITDTIFNYTQEKCGTPIDTIPPCPPVLQVKSLCDSMYNQLDWELPPSDCDPEVVEYKVYYANTLKGDLVEIASIKDPSVTSFQHFPNGSLAACYIVTAIDSFANESPPTNKVCIDVCFTGYELPNVFTPNGDNKNDLFIPVKNEYVEKVDMKIYNRLGVLVYETENPNIEWDGSSQLTNRIVTPGTYYYVCDVYEQRLSGLEPRALTGFIQVFSANKIRKP